MAALKAPVFSSMQAPPQSTFATSTSTAAGNVQAAAFTLAIPSSSSSSSSSSAATTQVMAQSEVAGDAPMPTMIASMGGNNSPDIGKVTGLQSRVTVNLGRREAMPTEAKRGY